MRGHGERQRGTGLGSLSWSARLGCRRLLGARRRDGGRPMTANKNFKRRVRARALKTGESYTAALRHFQKLPSGDSMPDTEPIRIAAQLDTPADPGDAAVLHRAGRDIRQLMSQRHEQGARLIHFCEGAICAPNKRIMSSNPGTVAEAELDPLSLGRAAGRAALIAAHAASLKLWTVVGAVHRLTAPHRPHNSLYVIDDHGRVVHRYGSGCCPIPRSATCTRPGHGPITFDVDGVRFGCALGMGLWTRSCSWTTSGPMSTAYCSRPRAPANRSRCRPRATPAATATGSATPPAPQRLTSHQLASSARTEPGRRRCPVTDVAAVAIAGIDREHEGLARPWRRTARGGRYVAAAAMRTPAPAATRSE